MEGLLVIVGIMALVIGVVWYFSSSGEEQRLAAAAEEERIRQIEARYGGSPFAEDLKNGVVRQGMTVDMVVAAWGPPAAVDRKVLKTKTKEVLKFGPGPGRSFANKVIAENGIVVGWEQR